MTRSKGSPWRVISHFPSVSKRLCKNIDMGATFPALRWGENILVFFVLNQIVSFNEKTVGQLRRWRWILHEGTQVAWSDWGWRRSKDRVLCVGSAAPRQAQAARSLWPCRKVEAVFRCRKWSQSLNRQERTRRKRCLNRLEQEEP